jgi:hypothetical protein
MTSARRALRAAPPRPVTTRAARGALLVALTGALTGCGAFTTVSAVPAVPVQPPAALAAVGDRPEPCPYLSQATVAELAGEQRTQIVGSDNTCSFTIGGQYTYQIKVQPDDNDLFEDQRARLYRNAVAIDGVGDQAFFSDGTAITVLGARQGDTFFSVTLVSAVADPGGGGGAAPAVEDPQDQRGAQIAQGQQAQQVDDQEQAALGAAAAAADADGDGVVDADQDGDNQIDEAAAADAIAAADADGDGTVDEDVAAAVQDAVAGNAAADGAAAGAAAAGGATGPVTDIAGAKARMTDIAQAIADSL